MTDWTRGRIGLRPLFIAAVTAVVLTTSVLLGWALIRDRGTHLVAELANKGVSVARILAAHAEYGVLVGDVPELQRLIDGLAHDPDLVWATIVDQDGSTLATGPTDRSQPWGPGAEAHPLAQAGESSLPVKEITGPGGAWLVVEAPISSASGQRSRDELGLVDPTTAQGPEVKVGTVTLAVSQQRVDQAMRAAGTVVALVTAAVVALGLALTVSLSTIIVSPVLQLAAASRRIAQGDMSVNLKEGVARELAELTRAFNNMSDALMERDLALQENAQALKGQASALKERGAELEEALATVEERNHQLGLSQEQLRGTNAELLHASRLKSAFLASMSHELRTPLNSIIGYTECMLDGLDGPINEDQTESLERVQRNGRHLLGLIGDILDLSKIEAGKMELSVSELAVGDLATECLAMVQPLARGKDLAFVEDIDRGLPRIRGDASRMRQVLINLLSNAVKFTDKGKVTLSVRSAGDGVEIAVEDTGRGIPPDRIDDVFTEFQQLEGPTSPGTGLGLAITKRLVELMGGTIKVKSAVDKGTTFTVWLPKAQRRSPTLS